nr:NAD+ synthase [Actinomycetota bacterium]
MIRFALAQINPTVGDIDGNVERIEHAMGWAAKAGAQVMVAPELAVCGYPPEDLVLKRGFLVANHDAVQRIAAETGELLAIVGFVESSEGHLYNAAAICHRGEVVGVYRKQLLPNYGVFDEHRYFEPGESHVLIEAPQGVIGVCVCEDIWDPSGPAISQADAGAQVVVNINASPYHKSRLAEREAMLCERSRRAASTIVYVNCVGGQDELVFDGGSLVIDPEGIPVARLAQFQEQLEVVDVPLGKAREVSSEAIERIRAELTEASAPTSTVPLTKPLEAEEEIYSALKLSLGDYARKNSFDKVVVGLSGGIDSTLTATIAVDALGPEAVLGVAMPSEYSTSHSIDDAKSLVENLGIEMVQIPIARTFHAYLESLVESLGQFDPGLAEENLQARIRGNLLMFISNRFGHLVVATGNKSEMACGYATLYGDMAGGFALLKDLFKTEVYALSRYRNTVSGVIPENVLTKPPSAELRPDQKDSDSLPPYEVLDPILEAYIERDEAISQIVSGGYEEGTVRQVVALVDKAEYKRRQAPPGPKVTTKAFGRDRRLPITNRWKDKGHTTAPPPSAGEQPGE